MRSLSDYISSLQEQLSQSQVKTTIGKLISKISVAQNCQLYSISKDKNEYVKHCRVLSGELKNVVDVKKLNISMLDNASSFFKDKQYLLNLHDVSSIRKPHSEKLPNLGKVKSLEGNLINGYETLDSVCVSIPTGELRLLQCRPFSNGDPNYVRVSERYGYENGQLKDKVRREQIATADKAGTSYRLKDLVFSQTRQISEAIKKVNEQAIVVDVYDRGFDDVALFEHTLDLGHEFVCRLKASRNSNEVYLDDKGKSKAVKLVHQHFIKGAEIHVPKIRFKKRVYQDVKGVFEWNYLKINDLTYSALRVCFYTRNGHKIFKAPMLLLTSLDITNLDLARLVFEIYRQRAKIEAVFKFCKETFGWEKPRVADFETMKNLLALVYFIAGYFYEIEEKLAGNELVIWLANLGNGKGKVTSHFLLKGLNKLGQYRATQQFFKEQNIKQEDIENALKQFL